MLGLRTCSGESLSCMRNIRAEDCPNKCEGLIVGVRKDPVKRLHKVQTSLLHPGLPSDHCLNTNISPDWWSRGLKSDPRRDMTICSRSTVTTNAPTTPSCLSPADWAVAETEDSAMTSSCSCSCLNHVLTCSDLTTGSWETAMKSLCEWWVVGWLVERANTKKSS